MGTRGDAIRVGAAVAAVLGLFVQPAAPAERSPELAQLIKAANEEGHLELTWGCALLGCTAGAQAYEKTMNELYGTNISLRYTPGTTSPQVASQIIETHRANKPAPTDAFLDTTDWTAYAALENDHALRKVDWVKLMPDRILPKMVESNGEMVRVFTQRPGGISYNTQLAPMKPTKLTDLLLPVWKGKLASTPYAAGFDMLSDVWGPDKAIDFATKLSAQLGGLMRCGEDQRIISGEFLAFAMDCAGITWQPYAAKGAPITLISPSDFSAVQYYYMAIPVNSAHPNAAELFTVFLLTPEGQKVMWDVFSLDLSNFPDSQMYRKYLEESEKKGVKPNEFTVTWVSEHPEYGKTQAQIVKILTQH